MIKISNNYIKAEINTDFDIAFEIAIAILDIIHKIENKKTSEILL